MLKLRIIDKRPPQRGGAYWYEEEGFDFEAKKFPDLLDRVREFRTGMRKPVGNVEQDVLAWMRERWPYLVDEVEGEVSTSSLATKAIDYMLTLDTSKAQFFHSPLSKDREEICRGCPFNVPVHSLFANSEDMEAQYQRLALVKSQGAVRKSDLGWCKVHGHDCRIAVHQEGLEKCADQPGKCWVV